MQVAVDRLATVVISLALSSSDLSATPPPRRGPTNRRPGAPRLITSR